MTPIRIQFALQLEQLSKLLNIGWVAGLCSTCTWLYRTRICFRRLLKYDVDRGISRDRNYNVLRDCHP